MKFDIKINFRKRTLVQINDFNFPDNQITFLLGESGIGKSLLARTVYGLLDPSEFDIRINKQPYSEYVKGLQCREIQQNGFFVFQEPSSHLNPLMRISDQLNEGVLGDPSLNTSILSGLWPGRDQNYLNDLLRLYPLPYRPSGGEKQRFLLTMAFKKMSVAQNTSKGLFIFDEPTGSLDNYHRDIFLQQLFDYFRQKSFTVLFISHDYSMISFVLKHYRNLIDKISFKELSRQDHLLNLVNFSVQDYLKWLQIKRPHREPEDRSPLLTLKSGFRIFNRRYFIAQNPDIRSQRELILFPGESVYLKAGSGVGKTTLAKIIIGLNRAENLNLQIGKYKITSRTPRSFWRKKLWADKAGMIFQHADEALNLNSKVCDIFTGLPKEKRPGSQELARQLGYFFGEALPPQFLKQRIRNLSGGQKQRLNILRTFVLDTDIILLDEPLNGLDFKTSCKIIDIILHKQGEGKGIILISHNEEIFDRLVPENRHYYLSAELIQDNG